MKKAGYRPETAAAISAAAATIGPIIPPSLPMVIYGVSADVSIGRLFIAGRCRACGHRKALPDTGVDGRGQGRRAILGQCALRLLDRLLTWS